MAYIKINKPLLDYHYFADFHAFTMNNFVRNVMQNGKYKKAVKIVRLGLLMALKDLHTTLKERKQKSNYNVPRPLRRLGPKYLTQSKVDKLDSAIEASRRNARTKDFVNNSYVKHLNETELNEPSFSFYKHAEYLEKGKYVYKTKAGKLRTRDKYYLDGQDADQYALLDDREYRKIYTMTPKIYYFGYRNLTVFDMVIQVYTLLSGVWYMRKSKVSGRTILIPSPLRPYRRITTATKMLVKGIRKHRRRDRDKKKAMIIAISEEFYWLVIYNGVQYTPRANMIDNSLVWLAKRESHQELVNNLKNIKHLKYF